MQTLQLREDSRIRSPRERRMGANMAIQATIDESEKVDPKRLRV